MSDMKKILLVDDDPDFVEAVKVIVESGGYEVKVAYDGKEGLEAVAEEKPDLIVLDVMMPVMNGHEACNELKKTRTQLKFRLFFSRRWPKGLQPAPILTGICWKVTLKTICQNRWNPLNFSSG